MDRRTFAVCAMTVVSLGFVLSDRCDTQSVSSPPTIAKAPWPAPGDLRAAAASRSEPLWDARVLPVIALAEDAETPSTDGADGSPLRVVNTEPESQIKFATTGSERRSPHPTRVLKTDTGSPAETELRIVARDRVPAIASSPASKKPIGGYYVPTNDDVAAADDGSQKDSSDRAAVDNDPPKHPVRKNVAAALPVAPLANRELPKQGVAQRIVRKRDLLLHVQSPTLDMTPITDPAADLELRFVARGPEPTLAKSPVPEELSRAGNVSASDHVTPDEDPSDRSASNHAVADRNHPEHDLPKQDLPRQVISKRDVPEHEHDLPDNEQPTVSHPNPITVDSVTATDSAAPRTELPWAKAVRQAPEMLAVIERADQRVRHGFQLAERGALYLARTEFVAALKLIAQANDIQQGTRMYSKAASAGLLALKESSDFVRQTTGIGDIDVAKTIAGHKTPILKNSDVAELAPIVAAQRYYAYAQEQLAAAAAQEMVGSMALYGLGKVAIHVMDNKSQQLEHMGQAMTLFQAALIAEPNNFRAANELGVLRAENGQLGRARELLVRSVSLSPQPATWHNLALVYARLGEETLAERAQVEARAMQRSSSNLTEQAVQWVEPAAFARMTSATDGMVPAAPLTRTESPSVKAAADPAKPDGNATKKGITDWLPWNVRH